MEKAVDKLVVLAGSLAYLAAFGSEPSAALVAALLAAVACSAASEVAPPRWRAAASLAPCALAPLAGPAGAAALPLALYDLVGLVHEPVPLRLAVVAPVAAGWACAAAGAGPTALGTLVAVALLTAALSLRTHALLARRAVAQRTRDDLTARALDLQERNHRLAGELEDARVTARPLDERPEGFSVLTEREWEVAQLVAQGLDNREIAAAAFMGEGTVRNHVTSALSKLHLKNRTQLAVAFWR